jgi:predicted AlkP superfamily pyrophosphatase or phosphodiesterase
MNLFNSRKKQFGGLLACLIAFSFFFIFTGCSDQKSQDPTPLLIVSFDGFRYNYFNKTETPNFDSVMANGVKARWLIPVFPSQTFPNHYAIVTGLYPDHSGIISNTMYDPKFDKRYSIGDSETVVNAKWYNGEPIWNTAEKQDLKAGIFFWPGSEAPIENMRPTYWKPYDGSVPNKTRIDSVVKWLSYPDKRAVNLAALYFSLVDGAGHRYGPSSSEVTTAVQKADSLVGYLKKKLQEKDLWNHLNLIIISDHGMVDLSDQKMIMLSSIINMDNLKRIIWGPVTMIWPKKGDLDKMYHQLKQNEQHYHIYKKQDLPKRYHLKDSRRVAPLVMVADLGYTILTKKRKPIFLKRLPAGTHGYDNHDKKMQAIFLAHGPAFKKDTVVPPFQNIHIYDLMAHLLHIKPAPNDGSLDSVKVMLN